MNKTPAQSRKSKVKALWKAEGPEAAITLGKRLKLADSTTRTWLSSWRREAEAEAKAKAKPVAKKKAKVQPAPVEATPAT